MSLTHTPKLKSLPEEERLSELEALGILDTAPEQVFDELVRIASEICNTPTAMLSFVDASRVWYKATVGSTLREVPREHALCHHAIESTGFMEIEDALDDPRFSDNPLVTSQPSIRYYAAAPLVSSSGACLGTLSILDEKAGKLTAAQRTCLTSLASHAMTLLEMRVKFEIRQEHEAHLNVIAEECPAIVWAMAVSPTREIEIRFVSTSLMEVLGIEPTVLRTNPMVILKHLTAQDRLTLERQCSQAMQTRGPFSWEGRLRCGIGTKWFQVKVQATGTSGDSTLWHGIAIDSSQPKSVQDELVDVLIDKSLINKELQQGIEERQRAKDAILDYQEQLRVLAKQVAGAEESERRRIATGLHDNVGQVLAALKMKISSVHKELGESDHVEALSSCIDLVGRAIAETRSLTFELASPLLYELGLGPALDNLLQEQASQHSLQHRFTDHGIPVPISEHTRSLLFSTVRELIINVGRHAHAQSINVVIRADDDSIIIDVSDDGVGFDSHRLTNQVSPQGGFGLFNIHERLTSAGGRIDIQSEPGRGTSITLSLPNNT